MIAKIKRHFSVIMDVAWNLISSILSTAILQLIVHPFIAKIYNEDDYGYILFIIGITNVIILMFGNALGDIRLTENSRYEKIHFTGDFNFLLLFSGTVTYVIMLCGCLYLATITNVITLSVIITLPLIAVMGMLHSYLSSLLRLRLMFKQVLYSSTVLAGGYLLGTLLMFVFHLWTLPFLCGYVAAIIYKTIITRFYKEKLSTGKLCKQTSKKYGILASSYLLKSSMTYVDRFVITPLLGTGTLSVYTVAATFGKLTTIAIQPVANVALGYYAQKQYIMTRKRYWLINLVTLFFGALAYLVSILLSKTFISILYPSYLTLSSEYILVANASSVLMAVSAMIQPAVLKYANISWQFVIQLIYGLITISLSILLIGDFGLWGFCYSTLFAGIIKLLIMLIVGDCGIVKNSGEDESEKSREKGEHEI